MSDPHQNTERVLDQEISVEWFFYNSPVKLLLIKQF
jgi:hypothetical protein